MTETNGDATDGVRLLIAVGGSPRPAVSPSAGSPTVVGRAADCDVVVADEVCSRRHCEIVFEGGDWFVRDLDSRNGTELNNRPIGRAKLRHGDVVLAGTCAITFVRPGGGGAGGEGQTAAGPMTEILERRQRSTFAADLPGDAIGPRLGEDLATLHRLTLAMGEPGPVAEVCGRVLSEVVGRVGASTGALLRSVGGPDAAAADASGLGGFELVAAVPPPLTRENLSDAVARVTLEDGDAVLARDVGDDSRLVERDSLGKLGARSVICAPLRHAGRVVGQLHLYGSEGGEFGAEQLDFALAVADQLAAALAQREEQERLSDKLDDARARHEELVASLRGDSAIVGDSEPMRRLRDDIAQVAPTDATVLVLGESGVGKELVARAVHAGSRRADGPLVCVNCAALAESLLESELFGHEKGAFTGATGRRVGKFEQADGGTLFLDEVGEMPPAIQAKFLRAMEGHPFERVGGTKPVTADVRIVAATNRDLAAAAQAGEFREDLYFRLNVVTVGVRPLRERGEDVLVLARHFLEEFRGKTASAVRGLSPEAEAAIAAYGWPGNVRELRNAIERGVILCRGEFLGPADLRIGQAVFGDGDVASGPPAALFEPIPIAVLERRHIEAMLAHTGGNKSKAASLLGIERSTLDRKLKRYAAGEAAG